uniref:Myelin protein zero-like 1 like n=1 Tax=Pygocentrus nattereri TaxID=42514 RepID=A0AAR2KCC4_PYGNA
MFSPFLRGFPPGSPVSVQRHAVRPIRHAKLPLGVSVCLSALRWTGDLSRVYPAFCPKTPGIGSSTPCNPDGEASKVFCTYRTIHCISPTGTYPAAAIEVYTSSELFIVNRTTGTLKCWFKSTEVISSQASVSWSFIPEGSPDATGIFYYSGGKAFPDSPQFKSRVAWAGDLNKNDASIRVTQMKFFDSGTYSCDVKNPPDINGKPSKLRVVVKVSTRTFLLSSGSAVPSVLWIFSSILLSINVCSSILLTINIRRLYVTNMQRCTQQETGQDHKLK